MLYKRKKIYSMHWMRSMICTELYPDSEFSDEMPIVMKRTLVRLLTITNVDFNVDETQSVEIHQLRKI